MPSYWKKKIGKNVQAPKSQQRCEKEFLQYCNDQTQVLSLQHLIFVG